MIGVISLASRSPRAVPIMLPIVGRHLAASRRWRRSLSPRLFQVEEHLASLIDHTGQRPTLRAERVYLLLGGQAPVRRVATQPPRTHIPSVAESCPLEGSRQDQVPCSSNTPPSWVDPAPRSRCRTRGEWSG